KKELKLSNLYEILIVMGKHTGLILGILVVVLVLVFLYQAKNSSNSTSNQSASQTSAKKVLTSVRDTLKTGGTLRTTTDWDWISQNGTHIPLSGYRFVIATKGQNGMGQYGTIPNNDITQVTQPFILALVHKTDSAFAA